VVDEVVGHEVADALEVTVVDRVDEGSGGALGLVHGCLP
jgi:hypothetical protein